MFGFRKRTKVLAAIGGMIAIGAVSLGGVVLAQTGGSGSPSAPAQSGNQGKGTATSNAFWEDVAKHLNVQPSDLSAAMKAAAKDQTTAAVQNGKLTQAQADQANQRIDNSQYPALGAGRFGGGGHGNFGQLGADLQSCATAAMTAAQNDKTAGKSAADTGKDVAAALTPCLDAAVANGHITAQQKQKIIDGLNSGHGPFVPGGRNMNRPGRPARPSQGATSPQTQ